jgi:hypothetical protein
VPKINPAISPRHCIYAMRADSVPLATETDSRGLVTLLFWISRRVLPWHCLVHLSTQSFPACRED